MFFKFLILIVLFGYIIGIGFQEEGIDLKEAKIVLSEISVSEIVQDSLEKKQIEENPEERIFLYPFIFSISSGAAFFLIGFLYFGMFLSEVFFLPLGQFAIVLLVITFLDIITFGFVFKILFAGFILLLEKIKILKIGGK